MSGYEYRYMPATMCYNAEHETNFAELDMDTMKAMVSPSNPAEVKSVAKGWGDVYTKLVGGDATSGSGGDGGIKKMFTAAIDEVLKDWEGEASEKFKAEAAKIAKKLSDGAEYARYTSIAMASAGNVLEQLKPAIESMEKPGKVDSGLDFLGDGGSRSDEGLRSDLARSDMTTQQALDNNRGDLSKGKEAQLEMAVKMEQLGAAYVSQTKAMGTWARRSKFGDDKEYPGEPGGTAPVPVVLPDDPASPVPTQRGPLTPTGQGPGVNSELSSPHTQGIVGGAQQAPIQTSSIGNPGSQIGTGLNGISGGTSISAGGSGLVGGSGLGTPPGGGSGGPSGVTGLPGAVGAFNGAGNRSGAGAGSGTRRGGMPGTPGAGSSNKAGASAASKAGLAKKKGGVIGATPGKAGAKGQGGAGLHRSRGGVQAGQTGSRPGAQTHGDEEEGSANKRPDYLVEDEETWAPESKAAPKVIE